MQCYKGLYVGKYENDKNYMTKQCQRRDIDDRKVEYGQEKMFCGKELEEGLGRHKILSDSLKSASLILKCAVKPSS